MALTPRNSSWGGASTQTSELLTAYITDIIRALEPDLYYAKLGTRRDAPKGSDRIVFPQPNQIPVKINVSMVTVGGPGVGGAGSVWGAGASLLGGDPNSIAAAGGYPVSSVYGVAAITEGSNPTAITWGANSFSTGPAQYGVLVQVSDLLVRNSAIEVIQNATQEVKNALARMVDTVIQTVVNAGSSGVIYSGGKTARTSLAAGDLITQADMIKATTWLRASNAAGLKDFGGYYTAIIHPTVAGDLMSNSATGSYQDIARYTSVDDLKMGKLGGFRGVRYLEGAWQNYFASTVPVMPTTVIGQDSFGWGYFQEPQAILTTTADSNNALNLYSSIGGKVTLGVTRFNDTVGSPRIVRVESAFTA
jgi:N4-gp56 family major capsid protein